jgi:hypothetical protein
VVVVKDPEADVAIKDDGKTEIKECCPKIMTTKFLKFKENNRPPYRGTWRKKSKLLTPRNPFKMDKVSIVSTGIWNFVVVDALY